MGEILQVMSEEWHSQVAHVAVSLREQLSISQDPLQEILICRSHPGTNQVKGRETHNHPNITFLYSLLYIDCVDGTIDSTALFSKRVDGERNSLDSHEVRRRSF